MPVVAITASALREEVQQCYDCGMDGFLSKPVEITKLHDTLKKWVPGRPGVIPPVSGAAKSAEKNGNAPVDLTFLKETFGDDDAAIIEILKEFVAPSTECCQEVEQAFSEDSLAGVGDGAHKLKSAARAVGAHDLADICAELETASKDGNREPVTSLVPKLRTSLRTTTDYIDQL
jgi:HPt (histidine-containing phosphotransfer) domain-containing protein